MKQPIHCHFHKCIHTSNKMKIIWKKILAPSKIHPQSSKCDKITTTWGEEEAAIVAQHFAPKIHPGFKSFENNAPAHTPAAVHWWSLRGTVHNFSPLTAPNDDVIGRSAPRLRWPFILGSCGEPSVIQSGRAPVNYFLPSIRSKQKWFIWSCFFSTRWNTQNAAVCVFRAKNIELQIFMLMIPNYSAVCRRCSD